MGISNIQQRSLAALDWPRLVEALVERARTTLGRERSANLRLSMDVEGVRRKLRQVTQMREATREGTAPFGGIHDVRDHVGRCRKGEILDGRALVEVADALAGCADLRRFFANSQVEVPDLRTIAEEIIPLDELQSRLATSFDRQGELSTVTYPHLAELRGRKSGLHASIRERLEDLTAGETWQGALQEDYLTQRNDRYVVPVKVQARSLDLGIVHDTSGSGQTVFVEPREVVGLNNKLKMADAELKREELAILGSLCEAVALWSDDLQRDLGAVAELDAISARARLAADLDACEPRIDEAAGLDLRAARHPLLVLRGLDVVPNDLRLREPRRALVLSGPNAGGKTISLKTLGLCALMVRAGMHLPTEAGSSIGLFPHLLADIGDQQSVEQDLSTFSGHVLALRTILETLQEDDGDALVLIDEIAVGTDPQQGAALAAAVLHCLVDRGARVAASTHFGPLKALAETDERFVNGRMEFDPDALRPTYRLTVGHPGRSYALDIARQLGLPAEVLARAESRLEPSDRELEALLASLEQERAAVRGRAAEAEERVERAKAAQAEAERQTRELKRRQKQVRADLLEDFDQEVEGYRASVRGIIRELQRQPSLSAADRGRRRIARGGREMRDKLADAAGLRARPEALRLDWSAAQVGDPVRLLAGDREAALASLPDGQGRLEVNVGGLRVRCRVRDLGPSQAPAGCPAASAPSAPAPSPDVTSGPVDMDAAIRTSDNTLDLRGERVDEALALVDRFLDEAALGGDAVVFILHGFGTGVLRKAVRAHLKQSPYPRRSRPASPEQGGDAFTAVAL